MRLIVAIFVIVATSFVSSDDFGDHDYEVFTMDDDEPSPNTFSNSTAKNPSKAQLKGVPNSNDINFAAKTVRPKPIRYTTVNQSSKPPLNKVPDSNYPDLTTNGVPDKHFEDPADNDDLNEQPQVLVDGVPFVSLRMDGKHFGIGVIIAPQFVLTSWSILRYRPRRNITVIGRLGFKEVPSLTYGIKDVMHHFDFEVRPPANGVLRPIHDIAVVRINGSFNVDPDRMPNITMVEQGYKTPSGVALTLFGFGPNETPGEEELTILSPRDCRKKYFNQGGPYNDEFCAMGDTNAEEPPNLCNGDEGSPLLYHNRLIGIATWVFDDCDSKVTNPAVFSPIGRYRHWIDSAMKEMLSGPVHWRQCRIGVTDEAINEQNCRIGCEERNAGAGDCDLISRCVCRSNSGVRSYYELKYGQ